MKIAFISNYFNHHQSSLSSALHRLSDGKYLFLATGELPEEQRRLGYGQETIPEYVVDVSKDEQANLRCKSIISDSDVLITGSAPEGLLSECVKTGKLVFRYSERPLKRGSEWWKYPLRFVRWHIRNPMSKPIYMLCASAFTAGDYAKFGLFRNRCYKWGYFPETKHYDISELFEKKSSDIPHLLWAGRFINWKHPDDVVLVAQRLKDEGYAFKLDFIGTGVMEAKLAEMIREKGLEDCVQLLGSMKPEQVREHMERANIYMFTSDRSEGWGAVLNESMNSGCAVVVSHAIGSVPFLMKDGENGLIYESGNVDMLYEKVKQLLDNPGEQRRLGEAAYHTIADLWNAEVAAKRFVELSERILSGDKHPDLYEDGPCSKAEIIKDNWYR